MFDDLTTIYSVPAIPKQGQTPAVLDPTFGYHSSGFKVTSDMLVTC